MGEEIHRGLAASVHHGKDLEGGHPVAIKLFREHYTADPRFAIRFREHLCNLAGLTHENLVSILDYGLWEDRFYIVTEWVEGADLGIQLAENGALSAWWAATIARQACSALELVHRYGLVHRGIKPQNILLTKAGRVKLSDTGMGRLISDTGLSRTNVMLGSVGYISPEQARTEPVASASDIYSLGVVLFEMLTGRLPYVTRDAWSLVRLHAEGTVPSPKEFNPQIPNDLADVVRRALEKIQVRRFASAAEMESALAEVLVHGSLAPVEGAMPGGRAGRAGWSGFLQELIDLRGWMGVLTYPVQVGKLAWSFPFGIVLMFQVLASFLLTLAILVWVYVLLTWLF